MKSGRRFCEPGWGKRGLNEDLGGGCGGGLADTKVFDSDRRASYIPGRVSAPLVGRGGISGSLAFK